MIAYFGWFRQKAYCIADYDEEDEKKKNYSHNETNVLWYIHESIKHKKITSIVKLINNYQFNQLNKISVYTN